MFRTCGDRNADSESEYVCAQPGIAAEACDGDRQQVRSRRLGVGHWWWRQLSDLLLQAPAALISLAFFEAETRKVFRARP
jgi:hypothetical protein